MDTFYLGPLKITIVCDEQITSRLDIIFGSWSRSQVFSESLQNTSSKGSIRLNLLSELPSIPSSKPIFKESLESVAGPLDTIAVFGHTNGITFHFGAGALIRVDFSNEGECEQFQIQAGITPELLHSGRLEDVIFTSMAPILRRNGIFLTHAFAATDGQSAALFVGPSGSGKTTCGLTLIAAGWGYLANDVTMLRYDEHRVISLPTPGGIGISKKTTRLVPELRSLWTSVDNSNSATRLYFAPEQIVPGWVEELPVSKIFFPELASTQNCHFQPLGKAVALGILMENSIDHWDHEYIESHISLLEALCRQSDCFNLHLGSNVRMLPELISNLGS